MDFGQRRRNPNFREQKKGNLLSPLEFGALHLNRISGAGNFRQNPQTRKTIRFVDLTCKRYLENAGWM
jgi:hypothetical protein